MDDTGFSTTTIFEKQFFLGVDVCIGEVALLDDSLGERVVEELL